MKKTIKINGIGEIEKYCQNVLRQTTADIRDELTQEAFDAIVAFYESYSPKIYRRHYFNFLEHSFKKYYKNPHNQIYYGGVQLTPETLRNCYQDDTREVFDTVYSGYHGPANMIGYGWESIGETPMAFSIVPKQMVPSPRQRIIDKKKYIEQHLQDYIDNAQKKV